MSEISTQPQAAKCAGSEQAPSVRVVEATSEGMWRVRAPGSRRASSVLKTRAEAEARAREILRKSGGGELRVHGTGDAPLSYMVAGECALPGRRQLTRQPRN
jgi:hypothetical protein